MRQTYVEELGAHVGATVTVKGWLYHKREKGKLVFLLVRDGTGVVQAVVFRGAVSEADFEAAQRAGQESSLVVSGEVRADSRAPGGYELSVSSLRVLQEVHDYPIAPKEHGVEFLMDHRHLWLRSARQHAVLRIRAAIVSAAREYLDSLGYLCMDTPILTPAAVEGTTTLFPVDYFGEKAYLAQSGQLYSEAAIGAFGRVYCFGPTFRAEKSKTRRHLLEFWMLEPEMAYAHLEDAIGLAEGLVAHLVSAVLERRQRELEVLEREVSKLEPATRRPYPRISYDEAVRLINERGEALTWGDDFGAPQETALSLAFDQPVFVHHYPTAVKAFYMEVEEDRPELCKSVDLIAPEGYGEIIGGGERTARLDFLEERIRAHDLPPEAYEWYLDLRRYGAVPHSGFGLGLERTVAWICGVGHIRETIPFPRMLYRLYP